MSIQKQKHFAGQKMRNFKAYRSWRLIFTAIWGLYEEILLNTVSKLNQIWPGFFSYFMRFLHGKFGSTVLVFDQVLEQNPHHRQFSTRSSWKKRKTSNRSQLQSTLQKGDLLILPTQEVLNLVLRSKVDSSVAECYCRKQTIKHGKTCTVQAPLHTCLTLTFPQSLDAILDAPISPKLAPHEEDLYNFFQRCEEIGLVHQIIWMPSSQFTYVICNCCPCCCVVLAPFLESRQKKSLHTQLIQHIERRYKLTQNIKKSTRQLKKLHRRLLFHRRSLLLPDSPIVAKSAFLAQQSSIHECIHCGKCVQRCYFGARQMKNGVLQYDPSQCYGCGLCVSTCPQDVIFLQKRKRFTYPNSQVALHRSHGITHTHPHH
jgi:ferredoxin